jgi:uncharacterized protein YecE (DUF72 family)
VIFVGTSGYSFSDWVGPFYPAGTARDRMLEHYVRVFPAVEINSTYYRLPNPATMASIAGRTPPRFRITVKLHADVTHRQTREAESFAQFLRVIAPLEESGRFHGALAQFPYGFRNTRENQDYLRIVRHGFPGRPLFVEFRHESWNRPQTLALLRELEAGFVSVDEPALPGLFPPIVATVGDVAYLRLHGHNSADWWGGDAAKRYAYFYSDEELRAWAQKIHEVARDARDTFVFFNNCHGGSAAQNAQRITTFLREATG